MDDNIRTKVLSFINNPLFIGIFFSLDVLFIRLFIYDRYAYLWVADVELIKNFIEWFGVVYGLFIALVLVNIWQQFDTVEREFDREADAISLLYQSAKQINNETKITKGLKKEINDGIREYVSHVIDYFKQEHRNLMIKEAGDQKLEKIRDAIGQLVHTRERESLTAELVSEFSEATDVRGDRISHSKQHIPAPLWNISVAASVLWLLPFYGLNFQNNGVAFVLVGGVTVIVVAILVIINDLDDVFEGTWQISLADWELLSEKIDLKPRLLFVYDLDSSRFSAARALIGKLRSKRLCALYSLLKWDAQKKSFFGTLDKLAYLKIFHKDQYEELYERVEPLPVVIYKANSGTDVIVSADEINDAPSLTDLGNLIQERLTNFRSK